MGIKAIIDGFNQFYDELEALDIHNSECFHEEKEIIERSLFILLEVLKFYPETHSFIVKNNWLDLSKVFEIIFKPEDSQNENTKSTTNLYDLIKHWGSVFYDDSGLVTTIDMDQYSIISEKLIDSLTEATQWEEISFRQNFDICKLYLKKLSKHHSIEYLEWLLKEAKQIDSPDMKYIEKIQLELDYYKKQLEQQATVATNEKNETKGKPKEIEPIQWIEDDIKLIYLFDQLANKTYLAPKTISRLPSLIEKHFTNHEGKPIKWVSQKLSNKQLKAPRGSEKIDEIIKEIKNIKEKN